MNHGTNMDREERRPVYGEYRERLLAGLLRDARQMLLIDSSPSTETWRKRQELCRRIEAALAARKED